jgi:hypothetical protein
VFCVGDQRGGVDAPPDVNFVSGDDLVADDPHQGGGERPSDVGRPPVVEQLEHALDCRERGARPDDQGDAHACEVLGPVVAVGKAITGGATGDPEVDEDGEAGRHVGQMVKRITEQRDGS